MILYSLLWRLSAASSDCPTYLFRWGVKFGKSTISENIALYWAINNPKSLIYWVSPTDSQVQKIYKEITEAVIDAKIIKTKKASKGSTEITFKNGSIISFKSAASEDSLRGNSVDYMIIDEAAFIKRDTIESILLPMLNVRGKKCIFISTPKGKNYLFDYYRKGLTENKWKSFRYSTLDSPFVNEDLIQMFKSTLPEKLYKQEIEAEFIDSSSVFNNIDDCMLLDKLKSPVDDTYYAGVDIGLINDASVLSIVNSNGDLVNYFRWEQLESPALIQEIINLNSIWNFKKIMIESNNQGLPIIQDIKRKLNNIVEFTTTAKSKTEIINDLIHAFNMKEIKIIKDEYLKIELDSFIFKQNETGNIKFMAEYGFHDDCVMSLAIARHCFTSNSRKGKYVVV